MQKIPVFVISLKRATERRAAISEHLRSLGVEFEMIDGVEGSALTTDQLAEVVSTGCELSKGMIGCNLSHISVYRRIAEGAADVALILEDDARLSPLVVDLLRTGVDASRFDICFLDCADHKVGCPIFYDRDDGFDLPGGFRAHRLSDGALGCHALLVTRAVTARRLDYMLPIRHCIDIYQVFPFTIRFYAVTSPKAAWLSPHSLVSATAPRGETGRSRHLINRLRRNWTYHRTVDWITFKRVRRLLLCRLMKAELLLDPSKRWAPLRLFGKVVE